MEILCTVDPRYAPTANGAARRIPPALPLGVCVAGIGGFGAAHHTAVEKLEREGLLRLLATCDPRMNLLQAEQQELSFEVRQVGVLASFEAMLGRYAKHTDLITIATPIALHAPMHAACVNHSLACYLEKPPTLDPEELERMIAIDSRARFPAQVGFSGIVEPWRQALKSRLLAQEFGPMESIAFTGAWQRNESYYRRTPWAGRLLSAGRLVLDSCFGNAMAHHVHNALFFAGNDGVFSWAEIESVRCELYRANAIEGPDTVFSEAVTAAGIRLRMAMTHASAAIRHSEERIVCRDAEIRIVPSQSAEIRHASGRIERIEVGRPRNNLLENLRHYSNVVLGNAPRPLTTLSDSRPFVRWNALNYLAAGEIHSVDEPFRECVVLCDGHPRTWIIGGIENSLRDFFVRGTFPSSQGIPWAVAGERSRSDALGSLHAAVEKIAKHERPHS